MQAISIRRTGLVLAVLAMSQVAMSSALGQKDSSEGGAIGIFSSTDEYHAFMGGMKNLAYGPEGNAELQALLPVLNDIALNKPLGSSDWGARSQANSYSLLDDPAIRAELEVLDDQHDALAEAQKRVRKQLADAMQNLDLSNQQMARDTLEQLQTQLRTGMESILLPHQRERLQQIQTRLRMEGRSLTDSLATEPFRSELELNDKQLAELREEEQRIERELREKIARLTADARQELIGKLEPKQQKRLAELIGDSFERTGRKDDPDRKKDLKK